MTNPNANQVCSGCPFDLPRGHLVKDHPMLPVPHPDGGAPPEPVTDEELARHASRAYQLAAQHGEDQWIAVVRMMRAWFGRAASRPGHP
jgi:hypothetical protein